MMSHHVKVTQIPRPAKSINFWRLCQLLPSKGLPIYNCLIRGQQINSIRHEPRRQHATSTEG